MITTGGTNRLKHPAIKRVWVTDTTPQTRTIVFARTIVPIAPPIADALARIDW